MSVPLGRDVPVFVGWLPDHQIIGGPADDKGTPDKGMTPARLLELHGLEYLQACGFSKARRLLDEQRAREIAERERVEKPCA